MEQARLSRTIGLFAAFGLLAMALYFRFHASLVEPFWLDEAYSAYAAGKGFGFLWHVVPSYETHPPFYYSLLRCWTLLFGGSLAGYRSLGYVAGVLTLPLIWLGARDAARLAGLDPPRIAWGTVAFGAVSIALVAMTREVRPYPVMILVYAGTLWALVRLGMATERDGRIARLPFAAYLAGLALMLWLHNLGALYATAIGLAFAALVLRPGLARRDWAWIVGGHLIVLMAWAPAVAILADQAPTWVTTTWLTFSWASVPGKLAILYAAPGPAPGIALFVLAGLSGWRLSGWRLSGRVPGRAPGRRVAVALFALALVPAALSIALSALVAPVFIMRTMTPVAVPAMLLLAIGTLGWDAGWRRYAGLGAGLIVAFHMVLVDVRERQHVGGQQDWYGVVRFLAPRWRAGDVLLAYPNEGALPLVFALRDRGVAIAVRPVPTPVPSIGVGGWYPTGSRGVVSLPRDRLRAIARAPDVQAAPTVWLLRLGPRAYDKGDMFLQELAVGRRAAARLYWNPIDLVALRRVGAAEQR